jgi:hypothetical protein
MQLSPGALTLLPQLNAFFGGAATVVADTAAPCLVLAAGRLSEPVAIAKALALAASSAAAPLLGATPIIRSAHPSPLSAHHGFFGSRPFSRANELLAAQGADPVDWALPA